MGNAPLSSYEVVVPVHLPDLNHRVRVLEANLKHLTEVAIRPKLQSFEVELRSLQSQVAQLRQTVVFYETIVRQLQRQFESLTLTSDAGQIDDVRQRLRAGAASLRDDSTLVTSIREATAAVVQATHRLIVTHSDVEQTVDSMSLQLEPEDFVSQMQALATLTVAGLGSAAIGGAVEALVSSPLPWAEAYCTLGPALVGALHGALAATADLTESLTLAPMRLELSAAPDK